VSEDWAAVARAISARMAELDLSQRDLIERSQVSKAIVREIQHNTVQRRRSERTLEALSIALEWHPGHLSAVLNRRQPQRVGEPVLKSPDDIPGRLALIEYQLREIAGRLDGIDAINDRLNEINANVETVIDRVGSRHERPDR
jgi:DNA-binding Xre family transcriptional regulator